MKSSSLGALLLLVPLVACDANDAESGTDDAAASADATATPASSGVDDLAELRDYELTMDNVNRLFEAQLNMARVASRMSPAERAALEQPSNAGNATLAEMIAGIERNPPFRQALRDAGISPRDYAMTTMAMMQAGMAMSVLQMRPNDDQDSLTRAMDTNPENVRFMQEHMDEIAQRGEATNAEMERLFPDDGE